MRNLLLFSITTVVTVFSVYFVVSAFVEPAGLPPSNNVPAPINVGAAAQSKAGDLSVNNFTARDGVTLGGEKRTQWADGCVWEGERCHANSGGGFAGNVRAEICLVCANGQLTNFSIKSVNVEL